MAEVEIRVDNGEHHILGALRDVPCFKRLNGPEVPRSVGIAEGRVVRRGGKRPQQALAEGAERNVRNLLRQLADHAVATALRHLYLDEFGEGVVEDYLVLVAGIVLLELFSPATEGFVAGIRVEDDVDAVVDHLTPCDGVAFYLIVAHRWQIIVVGRRQIRSGVIDVVVRKRFVGTGYTIRHGNYTVGRYIYWLRVWQLSTIPA